MGWWCQQFGFLTVDNSSININKTLKDSCLLPSSVTLLVKMFHLKRNEKFLDQERGVLWEKGLDTYRIQELMLILQVRGPHFETYCCRWISHYSFSFVLFSVSLQRGQEDELVKIRKYYETSKEEELKLLDKPEQ